MRASFWAAGATLALTLRWGIRAYCSLASGVYAWPNEIAAAKEPTDRGTERIPVGPSGGKGRVLAVTPAFSWSLSVGNGMGNVCGLGPGKVRQPVELEPTLDHAFIPLASSICTGTILFLLNLGCACTMSHHRSKVTLVTQRSLVQFQRLAQRPRAPEPASSVDGCSHS